MFDRVLALKFIHFSTKVNLFVEKLQFTRSSQWAAGVRHKPRFSRKTVCAIDKVFSDLDVFDRVLVLKFIHFSIKS